MTDAEKREKVILGLESCSGKAIFEAKCPFNCPYAMSTGNAWTEPDCCEQLIKDALKLLNEQKPKVLSRSEAESYFEVVDCYSEKNPLYVEYQKPHPYNLRWATNETVRAWMSDFEISRDYGIDFRFWTSRPNDKQRKEAKWE